MTRPRLSKTAPLLTAQRMPALDQVVEAGVPPCPGVVAVGRVKHPSLALRADPRPRLLALSLRSDLEDVAVLLVVLVMDVGLVPGTERLEALHDRVRGSTTFVSNVPVPCLRNWAPTSAMYFGELRKQIGCAVQRHEPAAAPRHSRCRAFSWAGVISLMLA